MRGSSRTQVIWGGETGSRAPFGEVGHARYGAVNESGVASIRQGSRMSEGAQDLQYGGARNRDDKASQRHGRRIYIEFDSKSEGDAQDLAMAVWYAAQSSRATDFWVQTNFEMRPEDNWGDESDVEIVVRKSKR